MARLRALSAGLTGGSADAASSLSAGDVAARDQGAARALAAQRSAGDTTDYGFDILSVTARPLNGGTADFMAFEKVRFRDSGAARNVIELYHRAAGSAPWTAVDRVYLADNIDLPELRLDSAGGGHLLSADEVAALNLGQPEDVARRYATAVSVDSVSTRLPAGSFGPGQFTTGEITEAADAVSVLSGVGTFARRWQMRPGGEVVALAAGNLVFAHLQVVDERHEETGGLRSYFTIQDPKRVNYGGLLAPGRYSDVSGMSVATVAVVVRAPALADVVGRDQQRISVQGTLSPVQ